MRDVWRSRAHVNIGKSGLTKGLVNELKRRLKEEKVIKVRILKSCPLLVELDRKDIATYVAKVVNANLIDIRGYVFVLKSKEFKRE